MYLHKLKKPNGDIYLTIKEKYYVPNHGAREKTVEIVGYLSALQEQYDDPIAYFTQRAKELTEARKTEKSEVLEIDVNEKLEIGTNDVRNVGYLMLKLLYKDLQIDRFWSWKTRNEKMQFSTDQILRLLVFGRVLIPASKRGTFLKKDYFFEPFNGFSLDDIYNSLDVIDKHHEALQEWIYEKSKSICTRDLSVAYFDCTNYYFDISRPDEDIPDEQTKPQKKKNTKTSRKDGPEKNNRHDPIVEMGLLIDKNGIPVAYDIFPGNESEKVHMRPIINRVKSEIEDCRVIFVADRGLNTSDNIYWLNGTNKGDENKRDGYVYGQTVRGADAEFKAWVLSGGYTKEKVIDEDGEEVTFIHKSRIYPKELHVNITKPGQSKPGKKKVVVDQKQMVYYSEKYAKKQKADRAAMIARAKDIINHPGKYDRVSARGSKAYIVNIAFNEKTGEVVEGRNMSLDLEKIQEEEKYDGYYSIVTSELKKSDIELREIYRGLAQIEDAFKVTKTHFESRTVFVSTDKHIEAHFASCFVALVLIRLLELKLGHKFSLGQILDSLKSYNCTHIGKNRWQFTNYDEVIQACEKAFNISLNNKYRTQQEIQRLLKY